MRCYQCGETLVAGRQCPSCGADVYYYKKIVASSNYLYNQGLQQASERDLTGAIISLQKSLRLNKNNQQARNLLGLIYYEIGEMTDAISEWSISRALQPEQNDATAYLEEIATGQNRENIVAVIRKYNTAVSYCRQGTYDIAILQIKNILNIYPNFVRGHLMLALLYARNEEYDKARTSLKTVLRIDKQNTQARTYLETVEKKRKEQIAQNKKKRSRRESVSYRSGNETIIQPLTDRLSTPVAVVLNLLLGVIIGALVVFFLVVPTIRRNLLSEANETVTEANETVAASEAGVSSLEEQIASLQEQIAEYESADANDATTRDAYNYLAVCLNALVDDDDDAALEAYEKISGDLLEDEAAEIYETIGEELNEERLSELFSSGKSAISSKDYDEAITDLKEAVEIDETYKDGQLLYYLAQAYRLNGDTDLAITTYERVVELFEDTTVANNAQTYIDSLSEETEEEEE